MDGNDYSIDEPNKVYIIGGKGVGKTSLFNMIFDIKFSESVEPSEMGIQTSRYTKDKKEITFKELTDDENFKYMNSVLKNEIEDVLLVFVLFTLGDDESFKYAQSLISFINSSVINNKELHIFLLGNKYDLVEGNLSNEEKIKIEKYISELENCNYYDLSCKSGYGFQRIKTIIDEIEIPTGDEDDDEKLTEEERKKKVENVKGKSCVIY